jgi:hypothetical protein
MANRTVAVNFTANTAGYVAGVGKAALATGGLQAAVAGAVKGLIGPGALIFAFTQAVKWANATEEAHRNFSTEILKLQTQIGLTAEEMQSMGRAALSLGGATTKGPQELAEAMFFIASAGLRGAAAMDVLRSSARLSAIGMGDTKTIADLLTSAVNAYGVESLSAAAASDQLVSAVRLGKLEADSLAGAMGSVLPIAAAMGVSFEEVSGLMAAMSKTGTDAAQATTQLRSIMVSLLNPSQQANEAMTELGLTQRQLRDVIMEDGLWPALLLLNDAVGDNTEKWAELFPNIRALGGVVDLLGPQLEGNIELMLQHADATGALSEAYDIFSVSAQAQIDRLDAEKERLAILQGEYQTTIRARIRQAQIDRTQSRGDMVERKNNRDDFVRGIVSEMVPAIERFRNANIRSTEELLNARRGTDALAGVIRGLERELDRLAWNDFGDELDQYTINLVKNGEATLEQVEAVFAQVEALYALQNAQSDVSEELDSWDPRRRAATSATDDATKAEKALADALGFTNAEILDQIKLLQEQLNQKLALLSPVYDAIKAERDYAAAQDEVNRLTAEGLQGTEEYIDALFEQEFAFLRMQSAIDQSGTVIPRFIEHLNLMIEAGRLSEEQVQRIIDRLGEQGHAMALLDGEVVHTRHVHTIETVIGGFQGSGVVADPGALQFRARGGPIQAGRPYIVGEEGPELVIPSGSGRVMSAPQTQSMLGGASYNVVVNMPPGADGDQVVSALRRWERSNGPIPVGVR